MPTNLIKHDVKEGKGSKKSLEKKWDRAKGIAKKGAKNKKNPWPLAVHIYENMRDSKKGKKKKSKASVLTASTADAHMQVQASYRLGLHAFVKANASDIQVLAEHLEWHGPDESEYEVEADAFEGWINTLQYEYTRDEGETATVDASRDEVARKLKDNDWSENGDEFSKGEHVVTLEAVGDDKTKITSIK